MNFFNASLICEQHSASLVDISNRKQIEWLVERFPWVIISRTIMSWSLHGHHYCQNCLYFTLEFAYLSFSGYNIPNNEGWFIYRTSFWTGYTNNGNNTAYYWPDGSRVTNVNLMTGQSARGDCLVINSNGQWETSDCAETNDVACSLDVSYGKIIAISDFTKVDIVWKD
jgi:hypothetical protein